MKNNRKEKKLNKAERLARKSLIKETVIIYSILLFMILLFASLLLKECLRTSVFTISTFLNDFGSIFVIPLAIYLLSIPVYWFLRKPDHIRMAYEKVRKDYSKRLAEKLLVPSEPVNVVIINTRDELYREYILGLHDICEFYAILSPHDNTITIYSRFKDDSVDRLFDIITKEEFTTYCELPDDLEE